MATASPTKSRWLWLLCGGALLGVLALWVMVNGLPRLLQNRLLQNNAEIAREVEEVAVGNSLEAAIDAELDEFLQLPELYPTTPATEWDVVSERATAIEFDDQMWMCTLSTDPPPRKYREEFDLRFFGPPVLPPRETRPLRQVFGPHATNEIAVAGALQWLADHQQPDGGWSFAHRAQTCPADCQHEGASKEDRAAATALALLPFLGAGQTHKTGKYKKNVEAALYFVAQHMKVMKVNDVQCGIFATDTSTPAQSLCTLALCETYAMTHDKGLMQPAQFALNQLLREPVVLDDGFRWMAIRSGELAYLQLPTRPPHRGQLLPAIIGDRSKHKFAAPVQYHRLVSVGVLDRIFELKAPIDITELPERTIAIPEVDPNLQPVLKWLSEWGPEPGDLDYQYFATQSMRHNGGENWSAWHKQIGEQLIKSQEKAGHSKGSWHFADDHVAAGGGRLYCTALATMILEVYYRHLPVYGN